MRCVKQPYPTGERLIAAEKALEAAFASGKVDESSLRRLLADAESARSELRFIHLSQHYKTVQFLTPEQIKRYNILRGSVSRSVLVEETLLGYFFRRSYSHSKTLGRLGSSFLSMV